MKNRDKWDEDTQGRWVPYLELHCWLDSLDEREREEIRFAWFYAQKPHGTDGHSRLLLIGKLADRLMTIQDIINSIEIDNDSNTITYEDFKRVISAVEIGEA